MLSFVDVTVSFNETDGGESEGGEPVRHLLLLSKPSSTTITVRLIVTDLLATGTYVIQILSAVLLWQNITASSGYGASGDSGYEVLTIKFPIGEISVPFEVPTSGFAMLGDFVFFNVTIDQVSLPSRVSISNPSRPLQFIQRKFTYCT